MAGKKVEMFEVGPCESAYQMGFLIGKRFSDTIKSRLDKDLVLRDQLLPFAQAPQSQPLIEALCNNNKTRFPTYWDELVGIAEGSSVPVLEIILINFRKEILPFLHREVALAVDCSDDCSDLLVVSENMAIAAHNEDANVALVGHTYLVKGKLQNGLSFLAYTYAGELPSCAFGFNNHGLAFTLNSVPPTNEEVAAGGIGRNFISRDLLESTSLENAISRVHSAEVSVGHSYNLIDVQTRRIVNVETASRFRYSVNEVGATPFFHANMYTHLQVNQVEDANSRSRQKRADELPKGSKNDFMSVLGDVDNKEYPIYMRGPTLYTLCTAVIDLDEQTLSIIQGNPEKNVISHVFSIPLVELEKP
ncbi:acyl-coenzyme A:6-aminopenicillanic-acid-acyltransferase 40 kDa form-like [Cucurbita maxima]|uniref:Acyl-coenzyme A:6-aminopenicillanic-acid-acyltransferase 40 kDa form-like n=1 Tax=Cucurbita maxima TaxID=3661 RepID=A0A6J1JUL7_CUCMA|nr:acyl-coenzyme A:6-aminopenicillanic-acid-acyltransferase 40 kDa form-like [Cucurbita maxima]